MADPAKTEASNLLHEERANCVSRDSGNAGCASNGHRNVLGAFKLRGFFVRLGPTVRANLVGAVDMRAYDVSQWRVRMRAGECESKQPRSSEVGGEARFEWFVALAKRLKNYPLVLIGVQLGVLAHDLRNHRVSVRSSAHS